MIINIILPSVNMSGGVRVISIYAKLLVDRGHTVYLTSQAPKIFPLRRKIKRYLMGQGWPVVRPPSSHLDGLGLNHNITSSLRPICNEDVPDADVVLATYWGTGPWVAALSPSKGVKAIFLQGYETSPGHEDSKIDSVWRLPLKKIVISKWMIELALQRFGDDDVFHVPNSVDTVQFKAPQRGKQSTPSVGLLYSTLNLKGVDISLKALIQVSKQFPNLRVVAFGAESQIPDLQLPFGTDFHYLPAQQLIPSLYASCDVWLCGSRREGFHLPPLEAMACRCPVVSTRVGGPLDTVVDGVNGYLVDIDDADALAARIIEVLSLPESDWRRMSDAALATATNYTWDDATDQLESALRDIIDSGNLRRVK